MAPPRRQEPIQARCPKCGKLLGKVTLHDGTAATVDTWCKRCEQFVAISIVKPAA